MNNYRKYFNGGINANTDFELLKPEEWINAVNVRAFTTDDGATEIIEAIGGTVMLYNDLPSGTNYCIGGCADDSKNRLYFFNWNSGGEHGIYCYDKLNAIGYKVLLSSQVTGGLNFSKDKYIHSCSYVDNKIYWTDNLNEPRRINTEAGIKLNQSTYVTTVLPYANPLAYTSVTIIRRPPVFPLQILKYQDTLYPNNFILAESFQALYFYEYRDNERSAMSSFSKFAPFNFPTELSNAISLKIPFTEFIDDDILRINICVRNGNIAEQAFIVKTFDKGDTTEAALITAHNAGTTQLSYVFYNDIGKVAVNKVASNVSFHVVPLTAEAIELANNRIFLGNNKYGYNTPDRTSLQVALANTDLSGATLAGSWKYTDISVTTGSGIIVERYFYAYCPSNSPSVFFYDIYQNSTAPTTPSSTVANIVEYSEMGLVGSIISNRSPTTSGGTWAPYPYNTYGTLYFRDAAYPFAGPTPVSIIFVVPIQNMQFFKSSSTYNTSIAFYDRFRRKCGVVDRQIQIQVPPRTFEQTSFTSVINWTLSNTNALTEIPDWAYYYQIHITKNLTTRFFLQGLTIGVAYAKKDNITSVITYTDTTYNKDTIYALALNISSLIGQGLGYQYTEGDLVKIYKPTIAIPYNTRVIGQSGNYLLLSPISIGPVVIDTTSVMFEVYTPYKPSEEQELYFETGLVMPVNQPGTNTRTYSTLSGIINGDSYALIRSLNSGTSYNVEAMSPYNLKWKIWEMDRGWANTFDKIGQTTRVTDIVFSDVLLPGTKINGLSTYQPLNIKSLDAGNGAIKKLTIANKVQVDGSVLLAICENETESCYLGEQELFDTQGSAYIARASDVIGTTKALSGSKGTKHPESVFQHNGLVTWYDIRNREFVQYSNNGLFAISKNNLSRPANLFSKQLSGMISADVEALGSRPYVIGGFDPYHKECLFTVPKLLSSPPKGFLPDYSSPQVIYPYDIYDGQGKTLVYKTQVDKWVGSIDMESEKFINMGGNLFAFKNGALYICNQSQPALFFGNQKTVKIMYSNNPGAIHRYLSIGLECNKKPLFVHFRTEDPFVQSSDLITADFTSKEGVQYASILRDRFSPNTTGTTLQKQMSGDPLFGKALLTMLEFEFVTDPAKLQLRFSNIRNTVSKGHY